MQKSNYPIYRLHYKTSKGDVRHLTRKKRRFMLKLQALQELQTLKNFNFTVEYYKNGLNESINYTKNQIEEALKVARIFTAKSEERAFIK